MGLSEAAACWALESRALRVLGNPQVRPPTSRPQALHPLSHWFKTLRISRRRCRVLIQRAVPTMPSLVLPSPLCTHLDSHSLATELTPGSSLRLGSPHDSLPHDAPRPVQAAAPAGPQCPDGSASPPSTLSPQRPDGTLAAPGGSGPTARLEMEDAPGGRVRGPGPRPPDDCTHARTRGTFTPRSGTPNLASRPGQRRKLATQPRAAPPPRGSTRGPGWGAARPPRALTGAPVNPGRPAPGSPW